MLIHLSKSFSAELMNVKFNGLVSDVLKPNTPTRQGRTGYDRERISLGR